jgi:hypothetical protein
MPQGGPAAKQNAARKAMWPVEQRMAAPLAKQPLEVKGKCGFHDG